MSIWKSLMLECDICRRRTEAFTEGLSDERIRDEAEKFGWRRNSRGDVCPTCRPALIANMSEVHKPQISDKREF